MMRSRCQSFPLMGVSGSNGEHPTESSNVGQFVGLVVDVSADGHVVAARDLWNDDNVLSSVGHVHVFEQV